MKRISAMIFAVILILTITACEKTEEPEEISEPDDGFSIYLATNESVREFGYYDTKNLEPDGEPVLTGEDVRIYYWESHSLELKGSFIQEVYGRNDDSFDEYTIDSNGFRSYEKGGSRILGSGQYMAFIVVSEGEKLYSGTFPGSTVMPSGDEPVVLGDVSDNRIQIQFSGEGFDKRNQDMVYGYFKQVGKITDQAAPGTEDMLADFRKQLDELTNEYDELDSKYNALLENGTESPADEATAVETLVKWQKRRLDLYIIETQEGDVHGEYSDLLHELDLSKPESIPVAADYFWQMAGFDVFSNDRMFNVFEELYDTVIDSIPIYYSMTQIDSDFIDKALSVGIEVSIESGEITAVPLSSYLRANFELYLSDVLNEYLLLRDYEQGMANNGEGIYIFDDERIYVSMDDISDIIYRWKMFSDTYPNSYPYNIKARLRAEELLSIYLGKTQLEQSGVYDNENMELTKEAKDSYIRFIKEYRDSAYYDLISELFIVLEASGFRLDGDVLEYLKNIDFGEYGY